MFRISSRLPSLENRTRSAALVDTGASRLGRAISPLVDAHPGFSGIHPLRDARDAFAARCVLAQAADETLDVQYYIWRNDMSGTLLFKTLCDAADRGVRVRLLLDDNNTSGLDPALAALDSHPNIEVRLFNPFIVRRPRAFGFLTDFSRANRRMHNKSFTADDQATESLARLAGRLPGAGGAGRVGKKPFGPGLGLASRRGDSGAGPDRRLRPARARRPRRGRGSARDGRDPFPPDQPSGRRREPSAHRPNDAPDMAGRTPGSAIAIERPVHGEYRAAGRRRPGRRVAEIVP